MFFKNFTQYNRISLIPPTKLELESVDENMKAKYFIHCPIKEPYNRGKTVIQAKK